MANVSLMQQLSGFLEVTNQRQQMIAANMANVDTPGYHTQDIDFQKAIQDVVNRNDATMQPASIEVEGLPSRPDGNNVNIDRESMMLSQTQLQYQMGVELIKAEFHKLLTAIKEGS
ncbi:MAG: flagellar basal body protein [Acidobacteriaceae bacterium]|jgi:flagellar basal-body rod protein FlgB